MKLTKVFSTLLLVVLASSAANAAVPSNVTWTTEIETINDREGVIKWHADINEGWHIYGLTMPDLDDTPVPPPTSFTVNPAKDSP